MSRQKLAHWLRLVRQPSLIRRLLLSQMLGLAVLWGLVTTAMLHDAQDNEDLLRMDAVYTVVATIASNLADDPVRRQQTLDAFTTALHASYGDGVLVPQLFVWQEGRSIYHSAALLPGLRPAQTDHIGHLQAGGGTLRARTVAPLPGNIQVTLVMPGLPAAALGFHSRGFYLMPLAISLPLLALPAFFSLRVALRPWQAVADEITARRPGDLDALQSAPPHRELRPLVDSVNALLAQARVSLQRERNLVADAAHELRTPLAALRVNVEALSTQAFAVAERELLGNLLRCNERATRVVSQLLQLMRSEAEPRHEMCSLLCLYALAQDRLTVLDAFARTRRIELELLCEGEPPFQVRGSEETFTSLIDNLVENAIKYSPTGSTVCVRLARAGPQVQMHVIDSGPGIPQALHERVFDRFYRLPTTTQSGSGLGLTIARAAAERHGGKVALSSPSEGGLEVIVHIPLAVEHG